MAFPFRTRGPAGVALAAEPQRVRAVAEQGLHRGGQRQEQRVLPAAIRIGEQPAVAGMGPGRAEQHGDQRQRDGACGDAEQQQHATDRFGREDDVGQRRRQPDRAEELRRAGQREDEQLEPQAVRDEHRAEADAQQERGIRRGAQVNHGGCFRGGGVHFFRPSAASAACTAGRAATRSRYAARCGVGCRSMCRKFAQLTIVKA